MIDEGKDLKIISRDLMGVLPRELSGGNEENHEKHYSVYVVSQSRFEMSTSRAQMLERYR